MQGENPYTAASRSRADAEDALREIDGWLRGAGAAQIAEWLSEIYLVTAKREGADADFRAMIMATANRLTDYPGDLVYETILGWRGNFFPKIEELRAKIEADRRLRERRQRLRAVQDFLAGGSEKPKGPRPTAEQHARMAAFVAERRGAARAPLSDLDCDFLARGDAVHMARTRRVG